MFHDFDIHPFPASADRSTRTRVAYAAAVARKSRPDIIVVQQHLPSAAAIARKTRVPVILHRHNFQKPCDSTTLLGRMRRALKLRSYAALAGMIHVSQTCDAEFGVDWPEVTVPRTAIPNGLAVSFWRPENERAREILCIGRSAPEKGILETAQAMAMLLPELPGWRGRFILSDTGVHPEYHAGVLVALAPVADRVSIDIQVPYSEVRAACERAAIAIVPSKYKEAFGRTALEAHAGGAALISSGTGALREVSGDCALYVDVEPRSLAETAGRLVADTQLREALARGGRERAEKLYTTSAVSAQADAFFERVRDEWWHDFGEPARKPRTLWGLRRSFPQPEHPTSASG